MGERVGGGSGANGGSGGASAWVRGTAAEVRGGMRADRDAAPGLGEGRREAVRLRAARRRPDPAPDNGGAVGCERR
ncbi:hypothetical protein PV646_29980 [Streptomyces sp. ID05-26A]|nr:hypothetical protein [Streptomyces sp. ID05-26A]